MTSSIPRLPHTAYHLRCTFEVKRYKNGQVWASLRGFQDKSTMGFGLSHQLRKVKTGIEVEGEYGEKWISPTWEHALNSMASGCLLRHTDNLYDDE